MPTLYWWTGASFVSPYVITIAWRMLSDIITHHLSIAYEFVSYWSLLSYFSVATVMIATKLLLLLLPPLPLLPYYFATKYLAADIMSFRCSWIDNSAANTQEYSLAPLVQWINLGWILYLRKLLQSPILVGYQDLFLGPLPGSIALFSESLGIYICWSLWGIWKILEPRFFPLLGGEVRNCHLALHLITFCFE